MKDLRLVLALLMIGVGVGTIFIALTFNTAGGSSFFSGGLETAVEDPEIPPGTALAQKCAQPGVVNCFGFDSASALHYAWPARTVCDEAFKDKGTNSSEETAREAEYVRVVQNDSASFPELTARRSIRVLARSRSPSPPQFGRIREDIFGVSSREPRRPAPRNYIGRSLRGEGSLLPVLSEIRQRFPCRRTSDVWRGDCGGLETGGSGMGNPPNREQRQQP